MSHNLLGPSSAVLALMVQKRTENQGCQTEEKSGRKVALDTLKGPFRCVFRVCSKVYSNTNLCSRVWARVEGQISASHTKRIGTYSGTHFGIHV